VLISVLESRRARLLFIVDDAQWVDASSAELLAALERACAERPWLMLVARRDSPGGYTPSSGNTLALAPMPGSEIRRLVELATEAAPLRPHETDEVVRRAGGNPLFAIEIVRAARDIGSLDAVPESLEAAMAAQVDALDSDARRVLRYASVLGRSFSRHVLAGVLSEAGYDSAPTALERLEEFLVADDADQMRFRSDVVRETTYQGLAYRQRTRLHAAAAHILKRSADPASIADTLAIHYSNTIEDTHTWRYARLAGDRARRNYANADAARFYELALGAARRMPLLGTAELVAVWTDLGDARELAGEFDRSLDAYRRALEVVGDDAPARAELLFRRARAKERAGRFSAALRDLTLGLRLLEGDGSVAAAQVRARLNSFAAMVLFAQDRPRRARRRAERALVQARAAAEGLSIGRALVVLDLADLAIDGPGDGSRLVEALEIFRERGDIRLEAAVRANLGFVHAHACRWEEAVAWLASARDLDGRSGDVVGSAYSGINIGEILINQNRLDEAQATLNDALRVVRAAEFGEGVAIVEIQLGRILVERGRCTEAYAMLARACIEFERIGNLTFLVDATVVQADAQLRSGQPDAAWSLLDRVVARAASETITMRPKVAWIRGRILSALGNVDEALVEFRVGLDAAVAQRLRYYEARIREARHAALVAGGCAPLADDLALAYEIYAALGVRAPLDG
jgi:tetratricopeptide (TPR) repeat protein